MNCEEVRVDMRIPNPEGHAENIRLAQVIQCLVFPTRHKHINTVHFH